MTYEITCNDYDWSSQTMHSDKDRGFPKNSMEQIIG